MMTKFVKFLIVFLVLVKVSQQNIHGNKTEIEDEVTSSTTPRLGKLSNQKAKPLRSIFMGLYRNYKSTYLGNKTALEYTKSLKDVEEPKKIPERKIVTKKRKDKTKKKSKRGTVKKSDPLIYTYDNEYRYELGQGVNLTLDMNQDTVSVNLDEENIKDILLGIWKTYDDESGEGR